MGDKTKRKSATVFRIAAATFAVFLVLHACYYYTINGRFVLIAKLVV